MEDMNPSAITDVTLHFEEKNKDEIRSTDENATIEEIDTTNPDPNINIEELVRDNQYLLTHVPARPTRNVRQPDTLAYNSMLAYLIIEEILKQSDQKALSGLDEA